MVGFEVSMRVMTAFRRLRGTVEEVRRCRETEQLLQDFMDGELDVHETKYLLAHLEACRRCGLKATTYRDIKESLVRQRRALSSDTRAQLHTFLDELDAEQPFSSDGSRGC
jgi:hypothetical protein